MKTAKELLLAYLENIQNADQVIELFAEDAAIELPYLESLGTTGRWSGKETLYNFLKGLPNTFIGFKFKNIQIHIDTPEQAFGEYEVECIAASTGKTYRQHYMGRLVAKNGKIQLIREALDLIQVVKSTLPNGLADLNNK
ncbi:nuclear transport factor 2 family protein [Rhizosphaericola mali]|uniref:Nuclear transport factor 2 family protein n=1 Tax=Rhizosphaericola mali TaxID=2545455 RepID=A0A5P2G0B2_9BACT|nr:nuclear transport factor 2 family protein [Rhizosphaericola mali]QES87240.1 nuclear transport factor 2 family protein [Rhizosphaericola mali]